LDTGYQAAGRLQPCPYGAKAESGHDTGYQ
jgi:hypothetical protein